MDFKSIALTTRPSCRFHSTLRKPNLQIDGRLVARHFSTNGGLVTGASAISHAPNINPPTFVSPTSVIIIQDIFAQEGQGQVNTVIISIGMFSPIVFTGFRFFPSFLRTPSFMISSWGPPPLSWPGDWSSGMIPEEVAGSIPVSPLFGSFPLPTVVLLVRAATIPGAGQPVARSFGPQRCLGPRS
jgi:hypothetical protein